MTPAPGRRRFLALVAATPLAGCSGRLPLTEPARVDGDRLRRMASREAPTPPETLPVAIEGSFVAAEADRARALLEAVPGPFDADAIPNGAIRERLNRDYDRAHQRVDGVADAVTPFERLQAAGAARVDAREVRAAWGAIDADLTVAGVREAAPDIREAIDAFVSAWAYVGDDPVRAARVHAALERDVRGARAWVDTGRGTPRAGDGPFGVADVAEDLERARVDVDAATYLFDRYRASLDGAADLEARLDDARGGLRDRVRERSRTLPDVDSHASPAALVDRDVGRTAGVWALARLHRVADRSARGLLDPSEDGPRVASDVLAATRSLALLAAFDRLRARIEDGEDIAVTSAADVEALRDDARTAIEAAQETDGAPILTRAVLPGFARYLGYGDDEFEHRTGEPTVTSVERDAADYVVAAETCRALPDVAAEVATALRGA